MRLNDWKDEELQFAYTNLDKWRTRSTYDRFGYLKAALMIAAVLMGLFAFFDVLYRGLTFVNLPFLLIGGAVLYFGNRHDKIVAANMKFLQELRQELNRRNLP